MNDLKSFMEVAGCKTMREASQKLGITQPALSESIKRLESDLCVILFYRARTGITLTPEGRSIFGHAKSAMSILSEIQSINELGTHFGSRVVTIGCHPTVGSYSLPKGLQELDKVSPDYRVNFAHDLSRNIQSDIQQGLIDIGFVVNPIPNPDLIIRKIARDEVTVWTTPKGCTNKMFCNLDLNQTLHILRKWKTACSTKIHTDSLELIVRLTHAGLGFGILPTRVVQLFKTNLKPLAGAPIFCDNICLVYRPEFGKSQVEKEIITALRNSL